MTAIFFTVCVELESIKRIFEVEILEAAIILIEVVLVPVPDTAVSCVPSEYEFEQCACVGIFTYLPYCPSRCSELTVVCAHPR